MKFLFQDFRLRFATTFVRPRTLGELIDFDDDRKTPQPLTLEGGAASKVCEKIVDRVEFCDYHVEFCDYVVYFGDCLFFRF